MSCKGFHRSKSHGLGCKRISDNEVKWKVTIAQQKHEKVGDVYWEKMVLK